MLKLFKKYFRFYYWQVILAVLLLAAQAYGELSLPDYMARMVNEIQHSGTEGISFVLRAGGIMLLICFAIMASVIAHSFLASRIAAGLAKRARRDIFEKTVGFSASEFDRFSTASLITRTTNDVIQIQNLIPLLLRVVVFCPIMGIGGIIKIASTNSSMTWIIILGLAVISAVIVVSFSVAIPRFQIIQRLIDKVNLVMRESLSGILVIRAFGTQKYEERKFDGANAELTRVNLFIGRLMSFMMPFMMLVVNSVSLLIVWVSAGKINALELQFGDMTAFIQYSMQVFFAFLFMTMISFIFPRAVVSGRRITEVLDTESTVNDPKDDKGFDCTEKGTVEFRNVTFKYPGAEIDVLKDISFTALPGQTTAFIGSAGCGKSTLVNLIPRFYDVTSGAVFVDGTDIREVTQHNLRERIGYVPQKGVLFTGTIKSNIAFGSEDLSDEEIIAAAETAQASDFINEKPDKYGEPVSQGGANVSGGQKQRLSIARAIAKKPQIFIFDDSFSALDFKTDAALRKAIRRGLGDSTVLVVAQRIGSIKNAEQIIVLDEGEIVGKGTHGELLASCEIYRQIALSQLSQEELDRDSANSGEVV